MSKLTINEMMKLNKLGSVLIAKLTKDELCTLSLAHDCGSFDTIMDKEINPQVMKDFPELFNNPTPDEDEVVVKGVFTF